MKEMKRRRLPEAANDDIGDGDGGGEGQVIVDVSTTEESALS